MLLTIVKTQLKRQVIFKKILHLHCRLGDSTNNEAVPVLTIAIFMPLFSPLEIRPSIPTAPEWFFCFFGGNRGWTTILKLLYRHLSAQCETHMLTGPLLMTFAFIDAAPSFNFQVLSSTGQQILELYICSTYGTLVVERWKTTQMSGWWSCMMTSPLKSITETEKLYFCRRVVVNSSWFKPPGHRCWRRTEFDKGPNSPLVHIRFV